MLEELRRKITAELASVVLSATISPGLLFGGMDGK